MLKNPNPNTPVEIPLSEGEYRKVEYIFLIPTFTRSRCIIDAVYYENQQAFIDKQSASGRKHLLTTTDFDISAVDFNLFDFIHNEALPLFEGFQIINSL